MKERNRTTKLSVYPGWFWYRMINLKSTEFIEGGFHLSDASHMPGV